MRSLGRDSDLHAAPSILSIKGAENIDYVGHDFFPKFDTT